MSDVDDVREALNMTEVEFGMRYPAALAALDRMEARLNTRLTLLMEDVGTVSEIDKDKVIDVINRHTEELRVKNTRLRAALRLALEAYEELADYEGGDRAWAKAGEARKVLEEKA